MLLLKNVYFDGKTQDVLIKDNVFAQIKSHIEPHNCETIDCKDKAILPTFCNTHTHAAMMFLRGIGEDLELFDWLEKEIWPREDKLTSEAVYHLSRFAILEMIKTGTTMFLDMYFFIDQTVRAAEEMGIRAAITYLGMDMFDKNETKRRQNLAEAFLGRNNTGPLIYKGLSCHAVYTTSEELIQSFKEYTRKHKTYFSIHMNETQKEVSDCLKKYGKRPVELIDDWGILDENTIIAHGVHLDDDEINRIVRAKAVVAHNPTSNLKLNSGQMPLQKYLDRGVRVALGTDSVSSNNSLSMLSEMKIAALSGKNQANASTAAKVDDVFRMATSNGFEALGVKAGKIQEGYLADFMLLDLNNCLMQPNINLVSNLVYSADSSCITDVFCNGKPLMKNRVVADEDEIVQNFKAVCKVLC